VQKQWIASRDRGSSLTRARWTTNDDDGVPGIRATWMGPTMQPQMHRSQAIADLAVSLSAVTAVETAMRSIRRALRVTGLEHAQLLDERDMHRLLAAIAAEGGVLQSIAEQIAIHGMSAPGTDQQSAA